VAIALLHFLQIRERVEQQGGWDHLEPLNLIGFGVGVNAQLPHSLFFVGRFVNEWNNKAVEITGFSREEVFGQDLVQVHISSS
jgi:hypothetical protein